MKLLTLTAFLIMSVTMISCGGDDKDKSSKSSSRNSLSSAKGYLNLQNSNLEIGSQSFPPNQAYATVINQALMQARSKNPPVQPIIHNGVQKYRFKISAQIIDYNQGYQQPYNNTNMQGGYNAGMTQGTLNISSIVFY